MLRHSSLDHHKSGIWLWLVHIARTKQYPWGPRVEEIRLPEGIGPSYAFMVVDASIFLIALFVEGRVFSIGFGMFSPKLAKKNTHEPKDHTDLGGIACNKKNTV